MALLALSSSSRLTHKSRCVSVASIAKSCRSQRRRRVVGLRGSHCQVQRRNAESVAGLSVEWPRGIKVETALVVAFTIRLTYMVGEVSRQAGLA